jgi:hypothetical protein
MRISGIRREAGGGRARIAAEVAWEEADRPRRTVFFETEERFADALAPGADAFVTGCVVPAWKHGERRIRVEGAVCPELREGLRGALAVLASWKGEAPAPIAIEPEGGFRPPPRRDPPRTAALFSGGVDSLFTIRMNLLEIPRGHPAAIRDGILILGHDFGVSGSTPLEFERFESRAASLSELAAECGIELVPMRFNLRDLDDDLDFYIHEFFGAALAAAGHALTARISALSIPSSYDLGHRIPCASHPLLDPNYASAALSIRHDGAGRTRLEKLAVVAAWPEGLARLQTCNWRPPPSDRVNCGACEKCLRTAVGLLVLGRLAEAGTFRESDASPEALRSLEWTEGFEEFWSELPAPLRRAGRGDLAAIVEEKLEAARRFRDWREENDWKGLVKRFDRRYLGGRAASFARALRGGGRR